MLESDPVMEKKLLPIVIVCLFFCGCSWFHLGDSKPKSRRVNPDDLVVKLDENKTAIETEGLKQINVINQQKLKSGGQVVVIPFSPGVNIEANDTFDKVTLRIISGIREVFQDQSEIFTVLSSEEVDQADFIIEGRVIEIHKPSIMKRATFKNNRLKLSVQGKMLDRETDKPILVFSDTVEAKNKKETLEVLGSHIGKHIGQFIVNQSTKK